MSAFATFVERAQTNASTLDPKRVLLTVLAAPFFVAGWLAGWAARTVWTVLTLCWGFAWTAGEVGFKTASRRGES